MNEEALKTQGSIKMRHVAHMNESRLTYEWVMSHIRMRHVAHMNESRHMSHIRTSHVSHMYMRHGWVKRDWNLKVTHVCHMNESCLTCVDVSWMGHVSHVWISHGWIPSHTHESVCLTHVNVSWQVEAPLHACMCMCVCECKCVCVCAYRMLELTLQGSFAGLCYKENSIFPPKNPIFF